MTRSQVSGGSVQPRAEALIDAAAIAANTAALKDAAGVAGVMAVVKADGYGHGLLTSARAALAGGAASLGVALPEEALALRAAGIDASVLAWLVQVDDHDAWRSLVQADVEVSVSSQRSLAAAVSAASDTGRPARIHLKVDTGLGRGGAALKQWPDLVAATARSQAEQAVEVVGAWTHLAFADHPEHPVIDAQLAAFTDALTIAEGAGVSPLVRHMANSAATILRPDTHFDLVRPGIGLYGISPGSFVGTPETLGLQPAMTLRARVSQVKRVPAGHGVSYGHEYTTQRDTTLALLPVGYADGIPLSASSRGPLQLGGRRRTVAGRVCMDQVVVDVGDDVVSEGDTAVLFGPAATGAPTVAEWAEAANTISYEIVTRIGPRVVRTVTGN